VDALEWAVIGGMGLLVLGALLYTIVRLMHEPRTGVSDRPARLARLFLFPRFLDPLLAKPMTRREKAGWLFVLTLMIAVVVFTVVTGIGVRR